jgi:hypothetical protein
MAYKVTVCCGCGKELRADEPYFEQNNRREWYCKPCNKKWPMFNQAAQPIYDEVDKIKANKLKALRAEIFGKPIVEDNGTVYRKEEVKVSDAANELSGGNNA